MEYFRSLFRKKIGDVGAARVGEMLKENTSLTTLKCVLEHHSELVQIRDRQTQSVVGRFGRVEFPVPVCAFREVERGCGVPNHVYLLHPRFARCSGSF